MSPLPWSKGSVATSLRVPASSLRVPASALFPGIRQPRSFCRLHMHQIHPDKKRNKQLNQRGERRPQSSLTTASITPDVVTTARGAPGCASPDAGRGSSCGKCQDLPGSGHASCFLLSRALSLRVLAGQPTPPHISGRSSK